MPKPQKLTPLIPGSLEDLLLKAGSENGFFDLRKRGTDGKWLEERLVARLIGDMDYEADWTRVCDGIFFIRKQHGVNPIRIDPGELRYHPSRDAAAPGVPFDRYTTKDRFDRTITFYLSRPPQEPAGNLPVALFVQGSGCASVFSERDGKLYGGLQNLLLAASKGRCRVLVVEKPGVTFGTVPRNPGSAEEASAEFRREHTLPRLGRSRPRRTPRGPPARGCRLEADTGYRPFRGRHRRRTPGRRRSAGVPCRGALQQRPDATFRPGGAGLPSAARRPVARGRPGSCRGRARWLGQGDGRSR